MADFRRCLYALALVALLAGLTVPVSAQTFNCTQSTGVPPIVRAEGYTELMGDIILDCTGGIPANPGQPILPVNIAVNLDVPVTSQVTANLNSVEFLESLLIIDEPNSGSHPTRRILNCGRTEAPDGTQASAGVCSVLGGGAFGAQNTYDGRAAAGADPGHPNVFQGRSFVLITGQTNQVLFSGIPVDPPGTVCAATNPSGDLVTFVTGTCHRIIRITNIRGDATSKALAAAGSNSTVTITGSLQINPASGLPVDIPDHAVARVLPGLSTGTPAIRAKLDFIQCKPLSDSSQSSFLSPNPVTYTFQEGFENAFKPQSLTQLLLNGAAKPNYNYVNGLTPVTTQGVLNNQNVPGAAYDTESGFTNALAAANGDVPNNALTGGPPIGGAGNGIPFSNVGGSATNVAAAGIASQGTRLALFFTSIPAGSVVNAPSVVNLTNVVAGGVTGVAVLISGTTASGTGGTPATASASVAVAGGGLSPLTNSAGTQFYMAVYEVFFSNPNALEKVAIPLTVAGFGTPTPNLPSNLPAPGVTAQIQGSFAPFYDSGVVPTAKLPTYEATTAGAEVLSTSFTIPITTLAIPRFKQTTGPVPFYSVNKCSCNLLFPFVTNAPTAGGNYDTGIAISNTSLDPGGPFHAFGFQGSAQAGPIQFWYYNTNNQTSPAQPGGSLPGFLGQGNTQCTNVTTPGSCTGTLTSIPAGGQLLYILSSGGVVNGATPAGQVLQGAPGFTGYMIAQASFQYCHGFAYISKQGAGFQADNTAMGYLALVLDPGGLVRTLSQGENDAH